MLAYNNPYDVSVSTRDLLYLDRGKRDYIRQMTSVLESYEGAEPMSTNLSRHIYNMIHGFPEAPVAYLIKTSKTI